MKTAIKFALLGWVAAGVAANTCNVQIGFSGAGKTTRCMCIARDGPFEKCEWSAELDDYICESVPTLNIGRGADPGTFGYSMAQLRGTPHTVIDTEGTEGSDINAASMPALCHTFRAIARPECSDGFYYTIVLKDTRLLKPMERTLQTLSKLSSSGDTVNFRFIVHKCEEPDCKDECEVIMDKKGSWAKAIGTAAQMSCRGPKQKAGCHNHFSSKCVDCAAERAAELKFAHATKPTRFTVDPKWACDQTKEQDPLRAAENMRKANEARCVTVNADLDQANKNQDKACDTTTVCTKSTDSKDRVCELDCGKDGAGPSCTDPAAICNTPSAENVELVQCFETCIASMSRCKETERVVVGQTHKCCEWRQKKCTYGKFALPGYGDICLGETEICTKICPMNDYDNRTATDKACTQHCDTMCSSQAKADLGFNSEVARRAEKICERAREDRTMCQAHRNKCARCRTATTAAALCKQDAMVACKVAKSRTSGVMGRFRKCEALMGRALPGQAR